MDTSIRVFTPQQVADIMQVEVQEVFDALLAKELKGVQMGGNWRVPERHLLTYLDLDNLDKATFTVPTLTGISWGDAEPFDHKWPHSKGQKPNIEHHDRAVEAAIPVGSTTWTMLIGFCVRWAAGQDRVRANVFWGNSQDKSRTPIVQFVAGNDFEDNHEMASVIRKPHSNRALVTPSEAPPVEYLSLPTCIYRDIVNGPNAARCLAVLATESDYTTMARHAVIRSHQKGWI